MRRIFQPLMFHAYDWDNRKIRPELVTAPPYDVQSATETAALKALSPFNVTHLDVPASYAEAAATLAKWRSKGAVVSQGGPAYYFLATDYTLDGRTHTRFGVMGGLLLSPWGTGGVYPHEKTYPKAKADRMELMKATGGQLSPVFGVYDDPDLILTRLSDLLFERQPIIAYKERTPEGVDLWHRLWRIPADHNRLILDLFTGRAVYIADGHHRYETALAYRDERGPGEPGQRKPWDFVFACLSNIASGGVDILPYHRVLTFERTFDFDAVVRACGANFRVRAINPATHAEELARCQHPAASVLALKDRAWVLEPTIAPRGVTEDIFNEIGAHVLDIGFMRAALGLDDADLAGGRFLSYTPFAAKALDKVGSGEAQAALLLKAVEMPVLRAVSEAGLTMPRKSTYFFPKLPVGQLFHLFE